MRRVVVVLFALAAMLTIGGPGAWAGIQPGLNRPPNVIAITCTISPGADTVATSTKPSSVTISYRGITCNGPAAIHVIVNQWTQIGTHWVWSQAIYVTVGPAGGPIINSGVLTFSCTHRANVKADVAYGVNNVKVSSVWSNVARCS